MVEPRITPRVQADEGYRCPHEMSPKKREELVRAHAARELERQRDLAFRAYGREHPLRVRLVLAASLTALGLGDGYAAGMWGAGLGAGLRPRWQSGTARICTCTPACKLGIVLAD